MKTFIEILKHPLISYWSLAFFAYSMIPYIIKTWNKKIGTNYVIFSKRHYLYGYIGFYMGLIHSIAWLIDLNFPIIGIICLVSAIIGTIFGYLYKKNRKRRINLFWHGLFYIISVIFLITHSIWGN